MSTVTTSVFSGNNVQKLGDIVCQAPLGGSPLAEVYSGFRYNKAISSADAVLDDRLKAPIFTMGSGSQAVDCDCIPTIVDMQRSTMP